MPNYTHVQFISWEIYTGPNRGPLPWSSNSPGKSYTGLAGTRKDPRIDATWQMADIEYRVFCTEYLLTEARRHIDTSPTTLKIFMAPEFLYRGKGGAYIHDLINGWIGAAPTEFGSGAQVEKYPGLFGSLQDIAAKEEYGDWLFVFGTAISASFPTRVVDGKRILDSTDMSEIYNTALVQRGGPGNTNDAYASRKHYISPIDFLKYSIGRGAFAQENILPADIEFMVPREDMIEGSAIFSINGLNDRNGRPIKFGLEVCLDHAASPTGTNIRNRWGRIRAADKWANIQLVPSGGMSLQSDSIRLTGTNCYAFNCDGLTTYAALNPQWGAHTQIWNGRNNPLIQANLDEEVDGTTLLKFGVNHIPWAKESTTVDPVKLWDLGAGNVRVMPPWVFMP
jgi:hypothetical protein